LVYRYSLQLIRLPDDAGDGEVVHLIVHDDAGGGGHELAAPDQVDARRYCACVVVHFAAVKGQLREIAFYAFWRMRRLSEYVKNN
jgi:hypothetical protein